jgi:myo-inositol-1(or 4)-monophosphatase
MEQELNKIKKRLEEIIIDAGKLIVGYYHEQSFEQYKKDNNSPLTSADLASENFIIQKLQSEFGNIGIVSEEKPEKDNLNNIKGDYFVIDPLDSTKNFINNIPFFDISIALISNNEPIIGIVYDPIHLSLYSAIKDNGAFLNQKKIKTRLFTSLNSLDINFNLNKLEPDFATNIYKAIIPYTNSVRHLGNAVLETCKIAEGNIDALINQYLWLWDIAACTLIVEEAGGFVSNLDGEKLNYNSLEKQTLLVSSNYEFHKRLLKLIKKVP